MEPMLLLRRSSWFLEPKHVSTAASKCCNSFARSCSPLISAPMTFTWSCGWSKGWLEMDTAHQARQASSSARAAELPTPRSCHRPSCSKTGAISPSHFQAGTSVLREAPNNYLRPENKFARGQSNDIIFYIPCCCTHGTLSGLRHGRHVQHSNIGLTTFGNNMRSS